MRNTSPSAFGGASFFWGTPGGTVLSRFRFLLPILLFALFLSCATVSRIDGQPLAAATVPEEVSPLWLPFPIAGFEDDGHAEGGYYCLAYFSGTVSSPRLEFHALRVYLPSPAIRIVVADGMVGDSVNETLSTRVSSFVRDKGLVAGINALPFRPVSGVEGEPRTNVGLVIADGEILSPSHPRYDALVFFGDGSVAIKPQSEIESFEEILNAVGGFRRILEGYELVPRVLDLQPRHPRSVAGISSCGRFLYLLVVDGRRTGSVGSTEAETAILLRALGAAEGINFDGGGSSSLAMRFPDGEVRVVNTPVHGNFPHGRERAVAGVLGIGKRLPNP